MVKGKLLDEIVKETGLGLQLLRYRCLRLNIPKRGGIYIINEKEEKQLLEFGRVKPREEK